MKRYLKSLWKSRHSYDPLIGVHLNSSHLINNLNEFRKLAPGGRIAPVLKSNAYGHGIIEIAQLLEKANNIPFYVVDSYFEALALRNAGIRREILIIGYTTGEMMNENRLKNTVFTASSIDTLELIANSPSKVRIHMKIDTGMRRQGLHSHEIDRALQIISESDSIALEGICSHLSDSDNDDPSFTEEQIKSWNESVQKILDAHPGLMNIHLSATDGHRYSNLIRATVSRLGIGLYGLAHGYRYSPRIELKPVLNMATIISGVRNVKEGETVGYGNTFKAARDMKVATIPVGYFEGLDRRLSNKGCVQVGMEKIVCPIIGRVSMNITCIDVSHVSGAAIGTPVIVISDNSSDKNSILSMAEMCETIPYEIAVHIPAHLKRRVV